MVKKKKRTKVVKKKRRRKPKTLKSNLIYIKKQAPIVNYAMSILPTKAKPASIVRHAIAVRPPPAVALTRRA